MTRVDPLVLIHPNSLSIMQTKSGPVNYGHFVQAGFFSHLKNLKEIAHHFLRRLRFNHRAVNLQLRGGSVSTNPQPNVLLLLRKAALLPALHHHGCFITSCSPHCQPQQLNSNWWWWLLSMLIIKIGLTVLKYNSSLYTCVPGLSLSFLIPFPLLLLPISLLSTQPLKAVHWHLLVNRTVGFLTVIL